MATTKELLERMAQKVGARAVQYSGEYVSLAPDFDSTSWQQFTAPFDGYLRVQQFYVGSLTDIGSINMRCPESFGLEFRLLGIDNCCVGCIPMKKGDVGSFRFAQGHWDRGSVYESTVRFLKSVGGGGLRLLAETLGRGGAIWLRLRVYLTQLSRQGVSSLIRRAIQSLSRLSRLTQTTLQRGRMVTLTLAQAMGYCLLTTPQENTRTSSERQRAVESKKSLRTQITHATYGCLRARETLSLLTLSTQRLRQLSVSILQVGKYDCLAIEGGF